MNNLKIFLDQILSEDTVCLKGKRKREHIEEKYSIENTVTLCELK